ncbi:MAG: hypothetical protein JW782_06090 [Candidatus Saganbacteria bacterium]|nr:hypothetical protein [Candidatus Saganbacteria bacterium]
MRKALIYSLMTCFLTVTCLGPAAAEDKWYKGSVVKEDLTIESSDFKHLLPGATLRLEPGSKLSIKGQLVAVGSEQDPVVISISNPVSKDRITTLNGTTVVTTNTGLKEIEIKPYSVETEEIISELEAFRKQYAFVWVVLMGLQIYLVFNRATYW